jgi:ribosomal protein S12 methylthiotransferase
VQQTNPSVSRTFWIDLHGCAKNQVDAEEIRARLESAGWTAQEAPEGAFLIIVNSCGFIESAKRESLDAVLALKARHPESRILLAGCLSQRYPEALAADLPEADGIFGNADLSRVTEAAEALASGARPVLVPEAAPLARAPRKRLYNFPRSAYVKITEGCSNHCAFCAIPLIRGEARSRAPSDVAEEVRGLIAAGNFEINLIGQDLGAYGMDTLAHRALPELLAELGRIDEDFRVRMLYIHPDHFPEGLLDECARDPRMLPYFDLPFQHASAPILRAMNRAGDAETYLALMDRIRDRLPDAVLRSTFLVGFPGETESDFDALLDFQEKARLDWMGAFEYSREEGTPAALLKKRVPKRVAAVRRASVEDAQKPITEARLRRFLGRTLEVLVEEPVPGEDLSLGRCYAQAPDVDGLVVLNALLSPGDVVRARVVAVHGVDLEAVTVDR